MGAASSALLHQHTWWFKSRVKGGEKEARVDNHVRHIPMSFPIISRCTGKHFQLAPTQHTEAVGESKCLTRQFCPADAAAVGERARLCIRCVHVHMWVHICLCAHVRTCTCGCDAAALRCAARELAREASPSVSYIDIVVHMI